MAFVTFTLGGTANLRAAFVNDQNRVLPVIPGQPMDLAPGDHLLTWTMAGKNGATMTIAGKQDGKVIVSVNETLASPPPMKSGGAPFTVA